MTPTTKTAAVTSTIWVALGSIAYAYLISTQQLVIPNQRGYIESRHSDVILTPNNFKLDSRQELDLLVAKVIEENPLPEAPKLPY